jgi:bifunctional DNA-binding transcriptional regulator/antitoxin component of YhaV-PrlF toxin-antitoxin module
MVQETPPTIVRSRANGRFTIPAAMRRALDIDRSSQLWIRLRGNQIVISKVAPHTDHGVRTYTDEEIDGFFAEDVIEPAEADWVDQMLTDEP